MSPHSTENTELSLDAEAELALELMGAAGGAHFDRIGRLTKRALGATGAGIVLIDGELFSVLASTGLAVDSTAREMSWARYLHSHHLDLPQVTIGDNIDAQLAACLPLSNGETARSLATQRVRIGSLTVGLLCAVNENKVDLADDQLADLVDIAHWVAAELRVEAQRRSVARLESMRTRTDVILASVAEGVVGLESEGRC